MFRGHALSPKQASPFAGSLGRAPRVLKPSHRMIYVIADDIAQDWPGVTRSYAWPYVVAMRELTSINDSYYADSASSVIAYFLANAAGWRGETARRIKTELREMLSAQRDA